MKLQHFRPGERPGRVRLCRPARTPRADSLKRTCVLKLTWRDRTFALVFTRHELETLAAFLHANMDVLEDWIEYRNIESTPHRAKWLSICIAAKVTRATREVAEGVSQVSKVKLLQELAPG